MSSEKLNLYLTSEHECGYLPDRMATSLVPDPKVQMNQELYSQLIKLGYRRSGEYIYRPHCNGCTECQPCRVPVKLFTPKRSQKRCLKTNSDLTTDIVDASYSDEHFQLYQSYINSRHADGQMVDPDPEDFSHFLLNEWGKTSFIEIRKKRRLIAVAVTDHTLAGLSAVYNYFDPVEEKRSLGTYCILQQIQQAKRQQHDHLYMGYWIEQSQKMSYKSNFQPLEIFANNSWKVMDV
jgi:arginyl-tRNA--protein-N-Asp/Glu arginylyltransferase